MKFALVLYVNRSGSTLFSRMLSERSDDISVFPEVKFLMDLLVERERGQVVAGDDLYDIIRADPRFDALRTGEPALRKICAENTSQDLRKLMADLATARHGKPPELVVFKLNQLILFQHQLRQIFQGLGIIHVVRDPRAVVNSMLRTPVPEKPGFNMARGSAISAAQEWQSYVRQIGLMRAAGQPVFEVRYEDLKRAPDQLFRSLLSRYGLQDHGQPGSGQEEPPHAVEQGPRYALSRIDGALHQNVFKSFQPERLEAWRAELDAADIASIERICHEDMIAAGYRPDGERQRLGLPMALAVSRHYAAMASHYGSTLLCYLKRGDGGRALLRRFDLMVQSYRQRRAARRFDL